MEIVLDVNQLTVGDVEDIEDICGKPFEELNFDNPSAKLMKAIIFITGRRDNPEFTLDDARRVRLADVTLKESEPDPTPGGAAS